jgi:hypothetical protein
MSLPQWLTDKINEKAAEFTRQQIAAGRIKPDSIAAMTSADLRSGFAAPEPSATPTEAQVKEREAAQREADARAEHAMSKPASQMDANDKSALRAAVIGCLKGDRQ